jgi:hypothetical protein
LTWSLKIQPGLSNEAAAFRLCGAFADDLTFLATQALLFFGSDSLTNL